MRRTAYLLSGASLVLITGCAHKRPTAPIAPVSAPVQAPAAAPTPPPPTRKPPKRGPATAPPTPVPPPTAPPARAPLNLESRQDPAPDRAAVQASLRDAQAALTKLNQQGVASSATDDRERVVTMLDLARKAFAGGDLRQANDLSTRAAALARTLLNGR